jgi:hypothetical protein
MCTCPKCGLRGIPNINGVVKRFGKEPTLEGQEQPSSGAPPPARRGGVGNLPKWLGLFLGFLIIGGIVSGVLAWLSNRHVEEERRQLWDIAGQAYRTAGEAQAVIDSTYEFCSSSWIDATAENEVGAWESLVTFKDGKAVRDEVVNHYQKLCLDHDIEAYCGAATKTWIEWAVSNIGSAGDMERYCLDSTQGMMKNTFISSCVSEGATEADCNCVWGHIVDTYGFPSVFRESLNYTDTGESSLYDQMVESAISACVP